MHGRLFQIIRTDYLDDECGCYSYENYEIKEMAGSVFDYVTLLSEEETRDQIKWFLGMVEEDYSAVVDKTKNTFSLKKENVLKAIFKDYEKNIPLKDAIDLLTEKRFSLKYEAPILEDGYDIRFSFLDWVLECLKDDTEYAIIKVFDFHF